MCDVSPTKTNHSHAVIKPVKSTPRGSMCWKNEPWDMCAFGIFDPAASVKETCKLYRYKDTDDGSYLESYTTMEQLLSEDYAVSLGQPILADGGTCAASQDEVDSDCKQQGDGAANFAVSSCSLQSPGDSETKGLADYDACLAQCTGESARYMVFTKGSFTEPSSCICWIDSEFKQSCTQYIFRNPYLTLPAGFDGAQLDDNCFGCVAEEATKNFHECIGAAEGGGSLTIAPALPPSPSSPPYPPRAPKLPDGGTPSEVTAIFTATIDCDHAFKELAKAEFGQACNVNPDDISVGCQHETLLCNSGTCSEGRRLATASQEVVVVMRTTEDNQQNANAAAQTFLDDGAAESAFGSSITGTSVTSDGATTSGDPHLSFARGGEADFRGRHGTFYNFFSAPDFGVNVKMEEARFFLHGDKLTVDGTFITEAPPPPPHPSPRPARGPCHLAPRA